MVWKGSKSVFGVQNSFQMLNWQYPEFSKSMIANGLNTNGCYRFN